MYSYDIIVTGIVQGVGFRPFIKRIAFKNGLKGYVKNLGGGEVIIHIEGDLNNIRRFFISFWRELPSPAEIYRIKVGRSDPVNYSEFKILKSESKLVSRSIIPPDIGICIDCIREIEDPGSRWYRYPFNSCAWCGPRFSMMYRIPYDRENTSMDDFPLCNECRSEYEDLFNLRRFHAQGISCPSCGPTLWLTDNRGDKIDVNDPIKEAAKLIEEGYIIGVKGIGGFHIACRADDDEIVNRLRTRKRRPYKPFALMVYDLDTAGKLVELSNNAIELLTSPQRPILLLPRREDANVSKYVAPGLDTLGIMLPYSGIHYLLLKNTGFKYLIMTSGNYYEEPMEKDNELAVERIGGIVDYFLMHNRRIVNRVDDSVIRFTCGKPVFLRRSRGYAPKWLILPHRLKRDVIAFGAELQNVGGIGFDNKAILTQYIGDTDEFDNLMELDYYLRWFISTYHIDIKDSILVIDKHPKYNSSLLGRRWARDYGAELHEVQHHVAHGYSILAEYGVDEGVIIAIDGVGYGDDGNIWGGEVIEISGGYYKRVGHIKYYKMLGGDLATIYPARYLFSILSELYGVDKAAELFVEKGYVGYLRSARELEVVKKQYNHERILSSSLGRLLDSFSTLLNICGYRSYEGEPAMKLEASSREGRLIREFMNYIEVEDGGEYILDPTELFHMALEYNIADDNVKMNLAYTFQYTIGYYLGYIAGLYSIENGYRFIYLSGGAAVNDCIVEGIAESISKLDSRLNIRLHKYVPPGDGGISLGQIYNVVFNID